MKSLKFLIIFITFIGCLSNHKDNKKLDVKEIEIRQKDSIEIQNLIRKVYKWHENTNYYYFNIGIKDHKYSLVLFNNVHQIF